MKTLALFGYFKLPEDFSGTMSDAIRQLAKYHESDEAKSKKEVSDAVDVSQKSQWQGFCKYCLQGDKRVRMMMGISELKQGQWIQIQGGKDAKSERADAADQIIREQA